MVVIKSTKSPEIDRILAIYMSEISGLVIH